MRFFTLVSQVAAPPSPVGCGEGGLMADIPADPRLRCALGGAAAWSALAPQDDRQSAGRAPDDRGGVHGACASCRRPSTRLRFAGAGRREPRWGSGPPRDDDPFDELVGARTSMAGSSTRLPRSRKVEDRDLPGLLDGSSRHNKIFLAYHVLW